MQNLATLTHKDVPVFSFCGLKTKGKVVRVVDGDTVHLVLEYQGAPIRLICRLDGIDTPETSKAPEPSRRARNRLVQLCTSLDVPLWDPIDTKALNKKMDENSKLLTVEFLGKEKYGRELVKIYDGTEIDVGCVNDLLVKEGHAKEYHGGKKV